MKRRIWTKDEMLQALQAWASTKGRVPRMLDWQVSSPENPNTTAVIREFGSWNHAIKEAGLEVNTRGGGSRKRLGI